MWKVDCDERVEGDRRLMSSYIFGETSWCGWWHVCSASTKELLGHNCHQAGEIVETRISMHNVRVDARVHALVHEV